METKTVKFTKRQLGGWNVVADGERVGWIVKGTDGFWRGFATGGRALAGGEMTRGDAATFIFGIGL